GGQRGDLLRLVWALPGSAERRRARARGAPAATRAPSLTRRTRPAGAGRETKDRAARIFVGLSSLNVRRRRAQRAGSHCLAILATICISPSAPGRRRAQRAGSHCLAILATTVYAGSKTLPMS